MSQLPTNAPVLAPDGVADPEPSPAPPAPEATPPKSGIDWSASLSPDDEHAPQAFRKFKTLGDAAAAHAELERTLTERANRIKELEGKSPKGDTPAEPPPSASRFNEALGHYYRDRSVPEPLLAEVAAAHNMSRDVMVQVLESQWASREQFMARAKEAVPDADIPAIEAWIKSGKSPFNSESLAALNRLARDGYLGWLGDMHAAYDQFVQGGGSFVDPSTKRAYGAVPDVSGRPAGAEPKGFESFQAYVAAKHKALTTGTPADVAAVEKKLRETPEDVQASRAWGRGR